MYWLSKLFIAGYLALFVFAILLIAGAIFLPSPTLCGCLPDGPPSRATKFERDSAVRATPTPTVSPEQTHGSRVSQDAKQPPLGGNFWD